MTMGTTRIERLQPRHTVTSPCKSCRKPSVKRYKDRSRRAFLAPTTPQWGQVNSTLSSCGSRFKAAQPVGRTPNVSADCRFMVRYLPFHAWGTVPKDSDALHGLLDANTGGKEFPGPS